MRTRRAKATRGPKKRAQTNLIKPDESNDYSQHCRALIMSTLASSATKKNCYCQRGDVNELQNQNQQNLLLHAKQFPQ